MKDSRFLPCALFISALTLCVLASGRTPEFQGSPYMNPTLPVDARVSDLVGRMTLEEKISQTLNSAPAIERLNIPAYDWWGEALHGVARAGIATVFPQAIGLAAMWDDHIYLPLQLSFPMRRGRNIMNPFAGEGTDDIRA